MRPFLRTLYFVAFTLIEYVRSRRFLGELIAGVAFFYLFFMMQWNGGIDARHFFTLTGFFTLAITFYTTSSVVSLGDRPQNYVILARRLGRTGYLMGLYLSALVIETTIYALIGLAAKLFNRLEGVSLGTWIFGSIPLLLNVALFTALLLMLSPLVFSTLWRLFVLSLIALAFSSNLITSRVLEVMPPLAIAIVRGLQTILSWPLVPVFSGFALALSRDYGLQAIIIILAQISLLIGLLGIANYSFLHREIIFGGE